MDLVLHDQHLFVVEVAHRCRIRNSQGCGHGVRIGDGVIAVGRGCVRLECVQYGLCCIKVCAQQLGDGVISVGPRREDQEVVPVELSRVLTEVGPIGTASDVSRIVVQPSEAALEIPHLWAASSDFVGVDDEVEYFFPMPPVIRRIVRIEPWDITKPFLPGNVGFEGKIVIPIPNVVAEFEGHVLLLSVRAVRDG